MKKLIFTLALSLSILSANAFRGFSELNLTLYDNSVFYVNIDNITYNYFTSSYVFDALEPGSHFISVIKQQYNGYFNTNLKIFSGYIHIPANMKIYSMINMYGSYVVISQTPLLGPDDTFYGGTSYYPTSYTGNCGNYGSYTGNYYTSNYFDYDPCMSQSSFMSLISTINNTTFESSKIKVASLALGSNYMTSSQVLMLLKCFTFESGKLEVAKLAYSRVVDPENFFKVNEAFTFDSSIDELSEFIIGQ